MAERLEASFEQKIHLPKLTWATQSLVNRILESKQNINSAEASLDSDRPALFGLGAAACSNIVASLALEARTLAATSMCTWRTKQENSLTEANESFIAGFEADRKTVAKCVSKLDRSNGAVKAQIASNVSQDSQAVLIEESNQLLEKTQHLEAELEKRSAEVEEIAQVVAEREQHLASCSGEAKRIETQVVQVAGERLASVNAQHVCSVIQKMANWEATIDADSLQLHWSLNSVVLAMVRLKLDGTSVGSFEVGCFALL